MNAGWQWIDGYCYYFAPDGKMAADGVTPDGYTVNADGQWTENGVAQYIAGKGIITKNQPVTGGSHRSSGGGSTGGSSGSGTGGNNGGSGDKYKVYEEANKETFEADVNVKAFANETTEDKQELKLVADSLVDYWIEDEELDTITENAGGSETVFQSVSKLNLVVLEDSPLYKGILAGDIVKGDVIVIPPCEYFPAGMSMVYVDDDDVYAGETLDGIYDNNLYQVLHTTEATFADIFNEEVEYHAGGVNSSDPVQYIWAPTLAGKELREIMQWEPETVAVATVSDADRDDAVSQSTPSDAASQEVPYAHDGYPVMPIANANDNDNKSELFSVSQTIGDKGLNLLLKADKVVLYDGDGDYETKEDQLILDGKIGLENINPEFGFQWEPSISDLMPKQMKVIVKYDQVLGLTLSAKDGVEVDDFAQRMREALDLPENKQTHLSLEMQGVDMDNTIVLACVGVNLGLNNVMTRMKDIQYNTKSVFAGLKPMIVFMVLMDVNGNLSVQTTLDAEYREETVAGINVQKQGFNGSLGTQAENKGNFNTSLMGYDINIFNQHDTTLKVSVKTGGTLELDTSFGIGAGIMCLGIMPAMVKGSLGLDSKLEGSGECSWDNKDGMKWKVEAEASMKAYLKARALLKLKCKAGKWFDQGIDKDFDLMDITLLEEKWSQTAESALQYDDSWEKILGYSEEQLAKEFKSYTSIDQFSTNSRFVDTYYYDGYGNLPIDEFGGIDYEKFDDSINFVICIQKRLDYKNGEWKEADDLGWLQMVLRLGQLVKGISDKTQLRDLLNLLEKVGENPEVHIGGEDSDVTTICGLTSYFQRNGRYFGLSAEVGEISRLSEGSEEHVFRIYEPPLLYGVDSKALCRIYDEYEDDWDWDLYDGKIAAQLIDKVVNPKAFVWLSDFTKER